ATAVGGARLINVVAILAEIDVCQHVIVAQNIYFSSVIAKLERSAEIRDGSRGNVMVGNADPGDQRTLTFLPIHGAVCGGRRRHGCWGGPASQVRRRAGSQLFCRENSRAGFDYVRRNTVDGVRQTISRRKQRRRKFLDDV